MAFEDTYGDGDDGVVGGADDAWPGLSLGEQAALEVAPKLAGAGSIPATGGVNWRDVAGKLWNAPNTALGLAYGGLGMAAGEAGHLLNPRAPQPKVFWRDNAVQFTNNPFGGASAITLGNTTTWRDDPYDPTDTRWHTNGVADLEGLHTYPEHETTHTYQGQELGPFYLPSNIAGGLMGLFFDRDENGRPDWHGPHNWNERGPQSDPPTPWAPRTQP